MPPKKAQLSVHPELGLPEVRKLWQTVGLFSDHYLKARIRKNSWWPSDEETRPAWQFCQELYNKRYVACAQNNEAFTRQELLDKILDKLGFAWTDNLGLPDQDAEPDYILFSSTAEKEAVIEKSREKRYRAAVAILEAKKVNHPLSQISKHQGRYPHQQIRDYLSEAQVLTWGIPQEDYEALIELLDIHPDKIKPWKSPTEFQAIIAEAIQKGTLKLHGREFDLYRLKHLCSFLFRSERGGEDRHFFHWELEFPEVFFHSNGTPRENPGFDAVIGNPPYIDIKSLASADADYLFASYSTAHLRINVFATFLERALAFAGTGQGNVSFIVPTAFLTQVSYSILRRFILGNYCLKSVVRLPNELFGGAAGEVKVDTREAGRCCSRPAGVSRRADDGLEQG